MERDTAPSRPAGRGKGAGTLFLADLPSPGGPFVPVRPLGAAGSRGAGAQAPGWRRDGSIVALAPAKRDAPPVLQQVDVTGRQSDVAILDGLPTSGAVYSARWDVARAQALIAVTRSAGVPSGTDYWLVRFGAGGASTPTAAVGAGRVAGLSGAASGGRPDASIVGLDDPFSHHAPPTQGS